MIDLNQNKLKEDLHLYNKASRVRTKKQKRHDITPDTDTDRLSIKMLPTKRFKKVPVNRWFDIIDL